MTYKKIPHLKRWDVDKFWHNDNFIWKEKTGCLEWQRYTDPNGYGKTSVSGELLGVHRLAYYIYYRVDPEELLVRHVCDNPKCANPLHLTLGTHDDNSKDMVRRKRNQTGENHWMKRMPERFKAVRHKFVEQGRKNAKQMNGAKHPTTVLTEDKVREIKERSAQGEGNRELAKAFGVTHSNISAIVLGKSWAHVQYAKYEQGEDRWNAKMNPDIIRDIRTRSTNGQSFKSIARHYEVSSTLVSNIVNRKTWKHID